MKYNTVYVGMDVHKYDWRSQNYLSLAGISDVGQEIPRALPLVLPSEVVEEVPAE